MQRSLVWVLLLVVALSGCRAPQSAVGSPPSAGGMTDRNQLATPDLVGRVSFSERTTQTNLSEVATGSTVSLIDTSTNQTVETSLTDASGAFRLVFRAQFTPSTATSYYLEAIKGLNSNLPGFNAARVRTIVRYVSNTGWVSLTNTTPNLGIVVSRGTTAVAIAAALRGLNSAQFANLVGTVTIGAPDTYAAPGGGPSSGDYGDVLPLIGQILTDDQDPVANIGLTLGNVWTRLRQPLNVATVSPASASPGVSVTFTGTGFEPSNIASNAIKFNGVAGTVTSVTPTSLTATVPNGAWSGPTVFQVGNTFVMGPNFVVPVVFSALSPTSGLAGSVVTLSGSGFDQGDLANNVVNFNGIGATVTGSTAGTLTVVVPQSSSCTVWLSVAGQTVSGPTFTYDTPLLSAIYQGLSTAGAYLNLEGNFAADVTVNFPGGISVAATRLGPNRAVVAVPPGATAGDLNLTSGGSTSATQSFRSTSFAQGVQSFTTLYEQTSCARASTSLEVGRRGHTSTVIGNYVYTIGGWDGATNLNSVERATINADGTLGMFASVGGLTLVTARHNHTATVLGNQLYIIGGDNGSALNSVERATINGDGTLGSFATVGLTLAASRGGQTAAVIGRYLYLVGGYNGGYLSSVERAAIASDGTLGSFSTVSGVALPTGRAYHTMEVVGNFVYTLGGYDGSEMSQVTRAVISGDGTLSTFSSAGSLLNLAAYATSAVIGHQLYVFGGSLVSFQRAAINPDGTLGTFVGTPFASWFTTFHDAAGCVAVGNNLYIIGGGDSGVNPPTRVIDRVTLDGNGELSTFSAAGQSLTAARNAPAVCVNGNNLYLLGGGAGGTMTSIERAAINPDGTLGSFGTPGGGLSSPRLGAGRAVIGNYLYLIGGYNGSTAVPSIERAYLNPNGTLGTFAPVGPTLLTARQAFSCIVSGNYLYVMGGMNAASAVVNTIERSMIASDGSIGTFSGAGTLPTASELMATAVVGNTVYLMGGWSGSEQSTVLKANINPDGSLGTFTNSGGSLVMARHDAGCAVIGNSLYVFGGTIANNTTQTTSVERATINPDGTLGAFNYYSVVMGAGRCSFGSVVLGNTLFVLGGYGGGSALSTIERATLQ